MDQKIPHLYGQIVNIPTMDQAISTLMGQLVKK